MLGLEEREVSAAPLVRKAGVDVSGHPSHYSCTYFLRLGVRNWVAQLGEFRRMLKPVARLVEQPDLIAEIPSGSPPSKALDIQKAIEVEVFSSEERASLVRRLYPFDC